MLLFSYNGLIIRTVRGEQQNCYNLQIINGEMEHKTSAENEPRITVNKAYQDKQWNFSE
jgi:hypothetical protein